MQRADRGGERRRLRLDLGENPPREKGDQPAETLLSVRTGETRERLAAPCADDLRQAGAEPRLSRALDRRDLHVDEVGLAPGAHRLEDIARVRRLNIEIEIIFARQRADLAGDAVFALKGRRGRRRNAGNGGQKLVSGCWARRRVPAFR